jgi:signal peptidase II
LKKILRSYFFLFVIAGVIVALDQWTKYLVRSNLGIGEIWVPWEWLAPYARIVNWYNTGVAFGMFQNANLFFAILAIIVSIGIIIFFPQVEESERVLRLALSMQLGGALGNLLDRLFVGHVTDFISVGSFPVFNVADSCISVGVAVLLLGIWFQERRERNAARNGDLITEVPEDTPAD